MSQSGPDADSLIALIHRAATGEMPLEAFITEFKETHESLEREGRVRYATREQAQLVWNVLWTLEFYDEEATPDNADGYTHGPDDVVREVKRVSERLRALNM